MGNFDISSLKSAVVRVCRELPTRTSTSVTLWIPSFARAFLIGPKTQKRRSGRSGLMQGCTSLFRQVSAIFFSLLAAVWPPTFSSSILCNSILCLLSSFRAKRQFNLAKSVENNSCHDLSSWEMWLCFYWSKHSLLTSLADRLYC